MWNLRAQHSLFLSFDRSVLSSLTVLKTLSPSLSPVCLFLSLPPVCPRWYFFPFLSSLLQTHSTLPSLPSVSCLHHYLSAPCSLWCSLFSPPLPPSLLIWLSPPAPSFHVSLSPPPLLSCCCFTWGHVKELLHTIGWNLTWQMPWLLQEAKCSFWN